MSSEIVNQYLARHADATRIMLVGPLAGAGTEPVEPVLFVDGGAHRRESALGVSLGDGDSYDGDLDHRLDPAKDFSDLAFALGLIGPNFSRVHLAGFLGGRRDHELLNLGEVFHFLDRRATRTRVTMDGAIEAFSAGRWTFESCGIFSLVPFSPCRVTLGGNCRYPIPPGTAVRPLSSFGLSNLGDGAIDLEADAPVFILHDEPLDLWRPE